MTIREIVELKKRYGVAQDITLDGISALTIASFDRASNICSLFENHGYSTNAIPGEFIKVFTQNANEMVELEQTLTEIDTLDLKDVFQSNFRVACFKKTFLDRLKIFLSNNLAFLNEDNTFISELFIVSFADRVQFCIDNGLIFMNGNNFIQELYDAEAFNKYKDTKTLQTVKTTENSNHLEENTDSLQYKMDNEDKQVYNEIVNNLNNLMKQYPTDVYLSMLANNIVSKIIPALIRKEYHFLPLKEVVNGVMFEGIDVTPEMENAGEIVLSFLPEEQKERGVA